MRYGIQLFVLSFTINSSGVIPSALSPMVVLVVLLEDSSSACHRFATSARIHSPVSYAGHVTPEAQVGGPIALVQDGDRIVVDAATRTIDWQVDEATITKRRQEFEAKGQRPLRVKRGILLRYARDVAVSPSAHRATGQISSTFAPSLQVKGRIVIEGQVSG